METLASQDRGREELGKRADRAMRTEAPVDLFAFWQLQALITPRAQLPGVVAEAFAGLIEIRLKEDNSVRVFANAGVHVVRRAEELPHRVKLPGVLLRVAQDDRLRAGSLKHVRKPASAGQTLFAASEKLYDGVFIFDAYLGPLWGALTPAIWSLAAHRELGTVVYSLGQPLAGTNGDAAELLQLIPNRAPTQSVPTPKLDSGASTEALDWWTVRLNDMFGVLSDPAVFTDSTTHYNATKHIQALLTVEQLFRRVMSLQIAHRDVNARRVLLFTVLDTLERLTGRNLDTNCTLSFAQRTLQYLESIIPFRAAELLLPAARRAVTALAHVQDGFYLQRQLRTADVELPDGSGGIDRLAPEKAAAEYLKLLRNATHGHGSNKSGRVDRTNALVAHHTGDIPDDLDLLGYLYLLDLLARPDVLRRVLYRAGR
jgi:hypothetical protein